MMSTCMRALLFTLSMTACSVSAFAAPSFTRTTPTRWMATQLPDFESEEAYIEYISSIAALPQGFATGTAVGKFVSQEAPMLGDLPIRGTVIHLTDGPTDSWAAVFTQNRVSAMALLSDAIIVLILSDVCSPVCCSVKSQLTAS